MEDAMQYIAGLLGGVAASALFWVVDKYLLVLPQTYQILGTIAAFLIFGLGSVEIHRELMTAAAR